MVGIRGWLPLILLTALPAFAQKPEGEASGAAPAVRVREWVRAGSQKVVEVNFDETTVIEGKVQKPGVEYLITQEPLQYEGLPMEHDLVETLERSARGRPF